MSGTSTYVPKSALGRWFESRLPIMGLVHSSFVAFPVPRNLNYLWTFGAILSFMLIAQIVTGIVLAMHYVPSAAMAFASIEHIMRDVNYGWLIRYLHTNGASMFFLAVYIHMFRGIYYGSYKAPREVLWILGVIIYLLMMATAFLGYVLPWGSMSFAGATVITNLFTAIPLVGGGIAHWLWGGYAVGDPTLNRFFSLHYLLPFMIVGVVGLHVWALHVTGQNNPDGVEVKNVERDTVAFTPYATIKDIFALSVFLILYAWFVFYIPELSARRGQFGGRQSAGRRPRISCRNGISCRSTRSCARSRTSSSASSPCSPRSCCSPSCPGSTPRRSSRPSTGRCSASSSGCSWSAASASAISARRRSPTRRPWWRGFSRSAISPSSSSFCRCWA